MATAYPVYSQVWVSNGLKKQDFFASPGREAAAQAALDAMLFGVSVEAVGLFGGSLSMYAVSASSKLLTFIGLDVQFGKGKTG